MVGKITKIIEILLSFKSKTGQLDKTTKQLRKFSGEQKKLQFLSKKFNVDANRTTRMLRSQGVIYKKNVGHVDAFGKKVTNMNNIMKKGRKATDQFNMSALGVMFAGMAIQRVFIGLARSATMTFTKILESNNMLGSAVQKLGVQFEFLKFTVGSAMNTALEPLMPVIMDIINRFTEWTQKNPKLISKIIILGIVLGTFLLIAGQTSLAIVSIVQFFGLANVAAVALGTSLSIVGLILLGLVVIVLAVKTALELSDVALGKSERNWHTKTGNMWKDFWGFMKDIGVSMIAIIMLIGTVLSAIAFTIMLVFKDAWNSVVTGWKLAVNGIKKGINWIIEGLNKVAKRLGFGKIKPLTLLSKGELGRLKNVKKSGEEIKAVWKEVGNIAGRLLNKPEIKDVIEDSKDIEGKASDSLTDFGIDQDLIDLLNDSASGKNNIVIEQNNTFEGGIDESKIEGYLETLRQENDKLAQEIKSFV